MQLDLNEIHIWLIKLTIASKEEQAKKLAILSADECERAHKFRFAIHRQRFIAARYALRQILNLYLEIPPHEIRFGYSEYKKPSLIYPHASRFQFNVAHSNDMAIYALTLNHAVGVDIEKVGDEYNEDIAKRFFNQAEHQELMQLPAQERLVGFYRIWARKEALIKAVGKGLSIPLSSFRVGNKNINERIILEDETWSLLALNAPPDYQAALASNQQVKTLCYWHFFEHEHELKEVVHLYSDSR